MDYKKVKETIKATIENAKKMKKISVELKEGETGYISGKKTYIDKWVWYGKYDAYKLEPMLLWMKFASSEKQFTLELQEEKSMEALAEYEMMKNLNTLSLAYDPNTPPSFKGVLFEFSLDKVNKNKTTGTDLIIKGVDDREYQKMGIEIAKLKKEVKYYKNESEKE